MVLAISAIFVFFIGGMLVEGSQAYLKITDTLATQTQLRYALDRSARELRQIGVTYNATGTVPPAYRITSPATAPATSSNSITFVKNDSNTVTISGAATPAATLAYSVPTASGKLADIAAAGDLNFKFYDRATPPALLASGASWSIYNLGAIEITLTVTVNGVAATGSTRVAMRGQTP
jgi:Tfp pilus assembly protein PilW